jgi:hypothetical protein
MAIRFGNGFGIGASNNGGGGSLSFFTDISAIATYLSGYMSDFRNPDFYEYILDGNDGHYIHDGGGDDMYDDGNATSPWLISNITYTGSSDYNSIQDYPFSVDYSNNGVGTINTSFGYVSLGYSSPTLLPLTVIGTRAITASAGTPIGFQCGGNIGADGSGTFVEGNIYTGNTVSGFTVHSYYRETYDAGDPSVCDVFILLGHPDWNSVFGDVFYGGDPSNESCGSFLYTTGNGAQNVLAIKTLLSKPDGGGEVTFSEVNTVVDNFILRIKEAKENILITPTPTPTMTPTPSATMDVTPTMTPSLTPTGPYYYTVNTYGCGGGNCTYVNNTLFVTSDTPLTIGYFYNNPENRGYTFEILTETTYQNPAYILTGEPGYVDCVSACNTPIPSATPTVTPSATMGVTTTPTLTPTMTMTPTASSSSASAPMVVTMSEVGSNVVMTASGTINLAGLTLVSSSVGPFGNGGLGINNATFVCGASGSSGSSYSGFTSVPSNFGSGSGLGNSSGTGQAFGVIIDMTPPYLLIVPTGYTSGANISSTQTFTGQTLSSLGLTNGTYTYTWSGGSIDVVVGGPAPTPTPTPSTGAVSDGWNFYVASGNNVTMPALSDGQALFYTNVGGPPISTYDPNNAVAQYVMFNKKNNAGTDYTTQFTNLQTNGGTINVTQNGNTATYVGGSGAFFLDPQGFFVIPTTLQTVTVASPFTYGDTITLTFS